MLANYFNIFKSTVQCIVTEDMCVQKISFKLHPKVVSYTAFIVTEYAAKRGMATIPQPPRRSVFAPPNFLLPIIKKEFKGHHFGILETAKEAMMRCSKEVPVKDFLVVYSACRCSCVEESYFEEI